MKTRPWLEEKLLKIFLSSKPKKNKKLKNKSTSKIHIKKYNRNKFNNSESFLLLVLKNKNPYHSDTFNKHY